MSFSVLNDNDNYDNDNDNDVCFGKVLFYNNAVTSCMLLVQKIYVGSIVQGGDYIAHCNTYGENK